MIYNIGMQIQYAETFQSSIANIYSSILFKNQFNLRIAFSYEQF